MRTKLNVLPPPKDKGQYDHVRARVVLQQTKSKQYTDAKRCARSPKVTVGAALRVCKPWHVGKGETQFSGPLTVQQQTGMSSFILSDRKRWNAACLSLCPEGSQETPLADTEEEHHSPTEAKTVIHRERKPPAWTKDYVMKQICVRE